MRNVKLVHNSVYNGSFKLRKLNLLFVFQVNCPGCFIYGIPVVNQLTEMFQGRLSILGLSTAFEDFNLNTVINTEAFVLTGKTVGETKKFFQSNIRYQIPQVKFPVAFDELVSGKEFVSDSHIDEICSVNPNFKYWPKYEQEAFHEKVRNHYFKQTLVAKSFALNQLKGTPSFVFFNERKEVILEHFGQLDFLKLLDWINLRLDKD